MNREALVHDLKAAHAFFNASTRCLAEADAGFAPVAGTWTVAQEVAHVAQTVDWFLEGAFRPEGFDLDFEAAGKAVAKVTSLAEARAWVDAAFTRFVEKVAASSAEELAVPLPEGPVMGGLPRFTVIGALSDHTAHHRGALTVYSRLLGKVPDMPYVAVVEEAVMA